MRELAPDQFDEVVGGSKAIWFEIAQWAYEFVQGFRDGFSGK